MNGYLIVGGKQDGKRQQSRATGFTRDGESYIGIEFKEENRIHTFFMLTGMTPVAAIARYRELTK